VSFRPAGIGASLAGALSVAALLLCGTAAAAGTPPRLSSKAAIVIDARTGAVLFRQRAGQRRAIASTTKLMTALLVLENTNQRTVFTAPAYHPSPGESVIGLKKGERMNVHDLLRAMLLPSANDAAHALAVRVGHTEARFVRQMNAEARRLGLSDTHYSTPIGLDDPHNYSSARDLARLAMLDMRDRSFSNIVGLPRAELLTGAHPRLVQNRNDLVVRYPFVDGVKTGHTLDAGYVLVGAAHAHGASVISVVLGDPSVATRDADSLALLRYGLAQYKRVRPVVAGKTVARVKVHWRGKRASLTPSRNVEFTLRRGTPLDVKINAPESLEGPLPAHHQVGSVRVLVAGKVVQTVPLLTAAEVPGAGFLRRFSDTVGPALITVALLVLLMAGSLVALRARAARLQRARSAR
jgi:serine-type D-Ala-D-Ala carboxypeptidase (penicillin-binding protein 5/6)